MRGSNRSNPAASHRRPDRLELPTTPGAAHRVVAHLPRTCGACPNPVWWRSTATARCRSAGYRRTRQRRMPPIGSLRTSPRTCGACPNPVWWRSTATARCRWAGHRRTRAGRVPPIGSLRTSPHVQRSPASRLAAIGRQPWAGHCLTRQRRVPPIGSLRTSQHVRCSATSALVAIDRHGPVPMSPAPPHPTTPCAAYRVVARPPRTRGNRPHPDGQPQPARPGPAGPALPHRDLAACRV